MKSAKKLLAIVLILFLTIIGCTAAVESEAEVVTAGATKTPSATPTLYPDVWAAGLLWDEARTVMVIKDWQSIWQYSAAKIVF